MYDRSERRRAAGKNAERQLAFYLHRGLGGSSDFVVLHDLRLVDKEQPEVDGRDGVCQIDHLVVHRFGMVIIESKSAVGRITVREDSHGGDEWTRVFAGRDVAIPSPIQQVNRQAGFLRAFLFRHNEVLLGAMPRGTRTLAKLVKGSDQRTFRNLPIQIIVAISDSGVIKRENNWKEPTEPFQSYVIKADHAAERVKEEFERHARHASLYSTSDGSYGLWSMTRLEVDAVGTFLEQHHTPQSPRTETAPRVAEPPAATGHSSGAACKDCGGSNLRAQWSRHGYYWRCEDCHRTTTMPAVCSLCGVKGSRGRDVRIRKEGASFFRWCTACAIEERIWTEPPLREPG